MTNAELNAAFLEAIDRINALTHPVDRAATAAAIFGRRWQSMSEAIMKPPEQT